MTLTSWGASILRRSRTLMRQYWPFCPFAYFLSLALAAISIAAIVNDRTRTEQYARLQANYVADLARQRTIDLLQRINGILRDAATAAADSEKTVSADRLGALLAGERRAEPGLLALLVLGADGRVLAADTAPTLRANELLPACLQDERLPVDQIVLKPAIANRTGGAAGVAVVCIAATYRQPSTIGPIIAVLAQDLIAARYADLLAGSHGVITLRDEVGRVLARGAAQPQPSAGNISQQADMTACGSEWARRIEVPAIASVAISGTECGALAAWATRSAATGATALTVITFLVLAAFTIRTNRRREALRLERLCALAQDLPGKPEREIRTRWLVAAATELVQAAEVPTPEHSNPPHAMPERDLSPSLLRPDLARLGSVALRRRDGVGFTAGDLAMLRVVARIAEIAIQHATALTTATALAQQLQHELQRASQAIDTIHREMSDAAFTLDRGGCFVGLNRRAETLFGECREDLRDRSIWQVFPELAGSAFEQECRRAISERHEVSFEFHWMRTDAWLTVHAFPRPDGLAVYMQDISRLVAANDKLRQAAKIEAIGRLTGGIAHSFNNTLQVIIPNVEVLELDVSLSSDAHMALDAIKRAADSAANLTNQLLAFARRQPLTPQVVDVVRLVDGLDAMLRGMLGALIKLEIRRPDSLWPVRVDPTQLQDAIINLSINARDAMASGGRLTIEAVNLPIRKPEIDAFGEIKPGNYVVISVSDTGIGIPKELLGNVFEPFFSTKPSGRGTGLGLAIVYGFVQQSGGHAKITSEVGRGTTVRLYLPSTAEARAAAGEPPDSIVPVGPNLAGGSEAILVVEDSEGVREVVTKDLSRLGYRVGAAADAEAALEMIEQGFSPDLLLTDVQLPGGLNGMGLGEMVRQQRPEIRVLYMSGYVEDLAAYADRLDPQTNLLRKPFSRAKLAARVRRCLDSELKSSGRHDSTE